MLCRARLSTLTDTFAVSRKSVQARLINSGRHLCSVTRPWALLIGLALLVPACQPVAQETPRLTLTGALVEMRVVGAQEIARTEHEQETVVVFYGEQGVQDVVAHVNLDRATQTVRSFGSAPVAAPAPGTMTWTGSDTRIYVYGRITDPAITTMRLEFLAGSRDFPVSVPGYAIVLDDPPIEGPQGWCFLDADGVPVYAPSGPC